MSPTQRSLIKLRSDGYAACVVEKWVPISPAGFKGPLIRRDVFGFADILACKPLKAGALLVQTTSGSNVASRVNKIKLCAAAGIWLAAGNKIEVHGWRKNGKPIFPSRGKPKTWICRVVQIEPDGR